jgi:glycosyltransferase involved in cell wall biosynthesis
MGRIYAQVADRVRDLESRYADRVVFMGRVAYDVLPEYLSACSVGIIPFAVDRFTEAVSPGKLYRYAAMGMNVVSTPFSEEIRECEGLIFLASEPADFARAVITALDDEERRAAVRPRIAEPNSWERKASAFNKVLTDLANRRGNGVRAAVQE